MHLTRPIFVYALLFSLILQLLPAESRANDKNNTPVATSADQTCLDKPTQLCIHIAGLAANNHTDAGAISEQLVQELENTYAENPKVQVRLANLGSRASNFITARILMNSPVAIENLTPRQRLDLYFKTDEYRENFVFALIRGTINGTVSSLTFVYSDIHSTALEILPVGFCIFFMSGGIQLGIDPFHDWLTNGSWSKAAISGLRQIPKHETEAAQWQARFEKWRGREFFAKWFATQFVFMLVIDAALIPTGVWAGQALPMIVTKTVVTSLFAMLAEGAPEGVIVAATKAGLARAKQKSEDWDPSLEIKYNRIRRALVSALAITCTALGSFRNSQPSNFWSVFVPSDPAGAILVGMGILGLATTKYLSLRRQRPGCARHLSP